MFPSPAAAASLRTPTRPATAPGTRSRLTATPAAGWSFSAWSGSLTGSANPTTVTMSSNKNITATFTAIGAYSINSSAGAGGSISPSGNVSVASGASQTFNITPGPGYSLSALNVDGSPISPPVTVYTFSNVNSGHTIAAAFARIEYALTLQTSGSGSISPSKNGPYYYGDVVQLTANPAAGWTFSGWSGALAGNSNPSSFTVSSSASVTAIFAALPTGGGGTGGAGTGGSGGGPPPSTTLSPTPPSALPAGALDLSQFLDSNGAIASQFLASSEDGNAGISISKGTRARKDGANIGYVSVSPLTSSPHPPPEKGAFVGQAYEFGPEGSTFDPPIMLSLVFDPAKFPSGLDIATLVLAFWDGQTNQWIPVSDSRVDISGHRVTAPVGHFSLFGLIAYPQKAPAALSVTGLNIVPGEITLGEHAKLNVTLANSGDIEGSMDVAISIDGDITHAQVAVAGRADLPIVFDFAPDRPGIHTISVAGLPGARTLKVNPPLSASPTSLPSVPSTSPAPVSPTPAIALPNFTVSDLRVDSPQVEPGQALSVSARVTNPGGDQATAGVRLSLDGEVMETRSVVLGAGAATTVTFAVAATLSGEHIVSINGLSGTFVVNAVQPGVGFSWWVPVVVVTGLGFLLSFVFNSSRLRRRTRA